MGVGAGVEEVEAEGREEGEVVRCEVSWRSGRGGERGGGAEVEVEASCRNT